jgi:DNA primase
MSKISNRLDFIDKHIQNYTVSKDGVNLNIWCPFCKDSNRNKLKMVIHLEKCFYHCWVCDKKGSNVSYLFSKISRNISELSKAVFLNRKAKISIFDEEIEEENIEPVNLPEGFRFFIQDFNLSDPNVRDVFKYAKNRGIDKHKLHILRAGYSLNSSLCRYLILPSYDKKGELNFYVSRNIDSDTTCSFKYKNAHVPKKSIIFNEINIDWSLPLTIVEGPLDLIKTNDNATCLLGSALNEDMKLFQEIVKNKTKVNLALDSDVYHKTVRIAKLLSSYDINVDILDTRGSEDVGDMSKEKFSEILDNSKSFSENDTLLAKIRSL